MTVRLAVLREKKARKREHNQKAENSQQNQQHILLEKVFRNSSEKVVPNGYRKGWANVSRRKESKQRENGFTFLQDRDV
jgi:hypothetical protein